MGALIAQHGRRTGIGNGFELDFIDETGTAQRLGLAQVAGLPLELASAARAMPSYRGQRSNQGFWWLATTGRHVGYESWLERDLNRR